MAITNKPDDTILRPRFNFWNPVNRSTQVNLLTLVKCSALATLLSTTAGFAAGKSEPSLAASIAQRSSGTLERLDIAHRSTAVPVSSPRRTSRIRIVSNTAAPAPVQPTTILDAVRLERTQRYQHLIDYHSRRQHVDAALIEAIVYTESGGDALAVSPAGARGLMQLMPDTAQELGVTDPLNPEQSIASGTRYLRELLDKYGSMELALWASNAGPGAVQRGILPAETEIYVPRVLAVRRALAAADKPDEETIR